MLKHPVLIIGAGVIGLVLAQALKKEEIPFLIFERDENIQVRSQGWGLTIHWALSALKTCLPHDLFERLKTIQVDPEQGENDTGQFLFLNLETAEPVFRIPPAPRLRINREKFRKLLLEGIDVHWNKNFETFESSPENVTAIFQDGTQYIGSLIVGSDGSNSRLRRLLCPENGTLNQLPIRFLGVTVSLSHQEIAPLRAVDPLLFQGCHPKTSTYLWFSILDTPEVNGSRGVNEYYSAQIIISWPLECSGEVPPTNIEKLKKMKELSGVFETRLRTVVQGIPGDTEVMEVKLADWPCLEWQNRDGRITLIGDAAHAMTMYRGEAANHGITDAMHLRDHLSKFVKTSLVQPKVIDEYEMEMRSRTSWAVLMSRQACFDAHDFKRLNKNSAILARRAR